MLEGTNYNEVWPALTVNHICQSRINIFCLIVATFKVDGGNGRAFMTHKVLWGGVKNVITSYLDKGFITNRKYEIGLQNFCKHLWNIVIF